jgi:hypothetical protein
MGREYGYRSHLVYLWTYTQTPHASMRHYKAYDSDLNDAGTKSSVPNRPPQLSAAPSTSSQAAVTHASMPPPVSMFSVAKLFQGHLLNPHQPLPLRQHHLHHDLPNYLPKPPVQVSHTRLPTHWAAILYARGKMVTLLSLGLLSIRVL